MRSRISTSLQSLPSEKLDNVVQIIKKRNPSLSPKDDEIEVDIDTFDTETLWELDRFVTNYKKGLRKNKRKTELPHPERIEVEHIVQEKNVEPVVVDTPKEAKAADERNTPSTSPVQVEKQVEEAVPVEKSSSSSSSSESGSSSSDSESDSSSGEGSDAGHSLKA